MKIKIASIVPSGNMCKSSYFFEIDDYLDDEIDYSDSFVIENETIYLVNNKPLDSIGNIPVRVVMRDPTNKETPIRKTYTLKIDCFDLETRRDDLIVSPRP